MTEQQRLASLLAVPACAEVNRAMQELSGAKYSTNEQNKETGKSRQRRDMKDTHTLLFTMSERNPFAESTSLRNIMTGVNATGDVDVCSVKEIGQKILHSMSGIPVAQYTVKRSDQVTTLQSKSSVRVDGQPIHVDPELLFQRHIVASIANAIDDRKAIFRFELCSYPSALFDDTLMPRAPQKAVLANAIRTMSPIWSSCYATTQIQMASTCSCSVRHGGQRRTTASGISKSPKVSWVLTSATTSCSYT